MLLLLLMLLQPSLLLPLLLLLLLLPLLLLLLLLLLNLLLQGLLRANSFQQAGPVGVDLRLAFAEEGSGELRAVVLQPGWILDRPIRAPSASPDLNVLALLLLLSLGGLPLLERDRFRQRSGCLRVAASE